MSYTVEMIKIDHDLPVAIWAQLAAQIEVMVREGDLEEGDSLPTVAKLAGQLNINHNTVHSAYSRLIKRSIITATRGRGTTVLRVDINERLSKVESALQILGRALLGS